MKKKFNRSLFFFAFLLLGLFFFARNDFTSVYAEEPETQDIQNESSEPGENTDDGSTTTDTTDTAEEPMENVPEEQPDEQPEETPALTANTPDPVTEIYLNGQSGDDTNDGTSEQSALKTFEKAKEFALHRVIQDKDTNETLTKADFDLAIECVKSSVLDVDRKEMELWIKNNR
jgi:hypothetical protein